VVGGTIKTVAAWRLERGVSLGLLEQLMGSQTVGGTVSTMWNLRAFNIISVTLGLLWSLSPLGGQSSILMISIQEVGVDAGPIILYLDTLLNMKDLNGAGTQFESGDDTFVLPSLNAIYSMSLFQTEALRNAVTDMWGNVKIPDLVASMADFGVNASGWVDISNSAAMNKTIVYSSLLGIPLNLSAVLNGASTTFTLESTYLSLNCTNNLVDPGIQLVNCSSDYLKQTLANGTFFGIRDSVGNFGICLDGFFDPNTWGFYGHVSAFGNSTDYDTIPPRTLLFQSAFNVYIALCSLQTAYVEVAVSCLPRTQASAVPAPPPVHRNRPPRLKVAPTRPQRLQTSAFWPPFSNSLSLCRNRSA